jgi:hypothetical protein
MNTLCRKRFCVQYFPSKLCLKEDVQTKIVISSTFLSYEGFAIQKLVCKRFVQN